MAAVVAQVEGWSAFPAQVDGHVYPEATAELTVANVFGYAYAGSLPSYKLGLTGYWLLCIWDANRSGVIGDNIRASDVQQRWYSVAGGDYNAVGYAGTPEPLLQDGVPFAMTRGEQYFLVVIAVSAQASEGRSANVTWPAGKTLDTADLQQLAGLTADGLTGRGVGDYEAWKFRRNTTEPPTWG